MQIDKGVVRCATLRTAEGTVPCFFHLPTLFDDIK
jgi:hypothetical protein